MKLIHRNIKIENFADKINTAAVTNPPVYIRAYDPHHKMEEILAAHGYESGDINEVLSHDYAITVVATDLQDDSKILTIGIVPPLKWPYVWRPYIHSLLIIKIALYEYDPAGDIYRDGTQLALSIDLQPIITPSYTNNIFSLSDIYTKNISINDATVYKHQHTFWAALLNFIRHNVHLFLIETSKVTPECVQSDYHVTPV